MNKTTISSICACVTQVINSTSVSTSKSNSALRIVHYIIIGSASFVVSVVIIIALNCIRKQFKLKAKRIQASKQKGSRATVSCKETTAPHYEDIGHAVEIDYEKLVNDDIHYESMIDLSVYEVPDIRVLEDEHMAIYTIYHRKEQEGMNMTENCLYRTTNLSAL